MQKEIDEIERAIDNGCLAGWWKNAYHHRMVRPRVGKTQYDMAPRQKEAKQETADEGKMRDSNM